MDIINIFKNLEQKEEFECGLPQSESQIQDLETSLNVKFPEVYKEFLRRYGYMSWFGGGIYGQSHDQYFDLLRKNRLAREEKIPADFLSLPQDAFIFKEYGGGGYYMLFSADSPRSGQVGLFLNETAYREEQTWESFEAFLEDYYGS